MNMAICSGKENVAVKTEITMVSFEMSVENLADAGVLLREAVGQVRSLSDSLLGLHPLRAEELGIDLRKHRDVRKFRDEETLEAYKAYLSDLSDRASALAEEKGHLTPFVVYRDCGFSYEVSSGRAYISLRFDKLDGEWSVFGFAKLRNPDIVRRNLLKKGFDVMAATLVE